MTLSIASLSPALGAAVTGIDLRQPLDEVSMKALRDAFDQNIVLCIRDQHLSEEDQLRAASYFGKVHVRRKPTNGRDPGGQWETPFMLVTNIVEGGRPIGVFGDGEMWFHHDTSYYPEPHRATLLYSMKLPTWGGNTCFSNMYKAYENIPRALRDRLEGRKVLQVHDYKRRERLDLDKIDYLSRDARACGVPYGTLDVDRLLAAMTLVAEPPRREPPVQSGPLPVRVHDVDAVLADDLHRQGQVSHAEPRQRQLHHRHAEVAQAVGRRPPWLRVPHGMLFPVAAAAEVAARFTGRDPFITLDGVRMSRKKMYFSSKKAAYELGYTPRPPREAIVDAVRWFGANGYLK